MSIIIKSDVANEVRANIIKSSEDILFSTEVTVPARYDVSNNNITKWATYQNTSNGHNVETKLVDTPAGYQDVILYHYYRATCTETTW